MGKIAKGGESRVVKKFITTTTITVALVALSVVPALAGTCNVSGTGSDSSVNCKIDRIKQKLLTLTNNYTLNQNVTVNLTSGNNDASNNTGDGTAAAGNVIDTHNSTVEANNSDVAVNHTNNVTDSHTGNISMTGSNSTVLKSRKIHPLV
ncbi:hypothetical protein HY008_03005 [Candidatus Woesebacteria bacterium]|nr:hypothetical protein [Candidatus Woesebacteria bacterium]